MGSLDDVATTKLVLTANNIVNTVTSAGAASPVSVASDCGFSSTPSFVSLSPGLTAIPDDFGASGVTLMDPRPQSGGNSYSNIDPVISGNSFLTTTTFKGAFGSDMWLESWSYLDVAGQLAASSTGSSKVAVSVTFNVDASILSNTAALEEFKDNFKQDLAREAGVPTSNVIINSVTAGSIVVDATVQGMSSSDATSLTNADLSTTFTSVSYPVTTYNSAPTSDDSSSGSGGGGGDDSGDD